MLRLQRRTDAVQIPLIWWCHWRCTFPLFAGALKIDLSGVANVIMTIGSFVQDVLSFTQNAVDAVYGVVKDVDDALGWANGQVLR
jgi:hypothetical protein